MKNPVMAVSLVLLVNLAPCWAQEVRQESRGFFATLELGSSTLPGNGNQLVIKAAGSLQGELTILATATDSAILTYTKRARTSRKSRAVDYLDQIAVSLSAAPTGLRLEMRAPNPAPWKDDESGLVEAMVEIPEGFRVEINAAYFDVKADGPFISFENTTSLGRLDVAHISERLEVETANRRVTVTDVSGQIRVVTTNATLTAQGISGLTQPAVFRNDGSDIRINGFTGGLNVKNAYGRIEIVDWDPNDEKSYVRCTSGPILIILSDLNAGQLLISNKYEDIELRLPQEFSAVLTMAVDEGGKIEAQNFPFTTELVEPNRLNLLVGNGRATISSSVRGKGNIYISAGE